MASPDKLPTLRELLGADFRQHPKGVGQRLQEAALGLGSIGVHYALRRLSIDTCSAYGAVTSTTAKYRFREDDARARKAWTTLRPEEADLASTDAAMRRLWRCIGRTMAEYSVLDRLWGAGRVEFIGIEHLHAVRAAGKPILIMALHLGNWELVMPALAEVGYTGGGIYLPPANPFEHYIALKVRARFDAELVAPGPNAARDSLKTLLRTKGYLLYADEFIRGRVQAPGFGRTIRPDSNIGYLARLAAMGGAEIVPVYCVRIGDSARFKVTALPHVERQNTGNREADLAENIARLDATIAPIVRAHLDQWFYALDFKFDT